MCGGDRVGATQSIASRRWGWDRRGLTFLSPEAAVCEDLGASWTEAALVAEGFLLLGRDVERRSGRCLLSGTATSTPGQDPEQDSVQPQVLCLLQLKSHRRPKPRHLFKLKSCMSHGPVPLKSQSKLRK